MDQTVPSRRALIVDDEFLIAFDLESSMRELGFDVCTVASNERDAIELALCFVQPMSELRVAFLEGFGELCSPTCPRQAAEPPFWEAPVGVKSGASSI
jgi:hypothetical protein